MNVVNQYGEKRNGFTEVVAFCHMTCRYFDRFLLQGVDRNWRQACFFYLAPGLRCEEYWQVNSRRLIFRIADPTYGLGAVLPQQQKDGELRPVAFISLSLSDTEKKYAQIEKSPCCYLGK